MPAQLSTAHDPVLGVGRAAVVYRSVDGSGRVTARKVFHSGAMTRLVQYVFLGAPNPYAWCEHAVQAAILRRRILAPLVHHWTQGRVRIAAGWNVDWNEEFQAWQLHTEFVAGRPPALHHPFHIDSSGELDDLRESMRALAKHLTAAGFDGQVWQAGLGNPVALSNFLCEELPGGEKRWAWIDLESGVPALFPAHIPSLWRFYLPRAFRYRRPLFDDVDVVRAQAWIAERRTELRRELGSDTIEGIERDLAALDYHQRSWRDLPRLVRSVRSQRAKGRITAEAAERYERSPLRWYAREAWRATKGISRRLGHLAARVGRKLVSISWRKVAAGGACFLTSHRFRTELAARFVNSRLDLWLERGQLEPQEADRLRAQLDHEEASIYLADFGVHLAIKPFVKSFEYIICPALFAAGKIDAVTLSAIWMSGGSVGRTLYTGGRLVQNLFLRRELPWTAFFVGLFPVLGNLAFPLQIVRSSREDEDTLARFLLYDGCSVIGRRTPIWGGPDTLTEHVVNRLPDRVLSPQR